MKVKDIKKLLTIGDTTLNKEVREQLKKLGFSELGDDLLQPCGLFIWEVSYYEVYVRYGSERRYNEGVEKIMELVGEGFYGEVFRVIPCSLYIIHLATGFNEYYDIQVIDKDELEEVGFLQVSDGFIYCGSQDDVSEVISELAQITPTYIKIY